MSGEPLVAPEPESTDEPGPGGSYRNNEQRVDQGMAFMGNVAGDITVINGVAGDESVTNRILKPRLREGPYPAEDVHKRLRNFVEPPSYAQCRKVLDTHLLILTAGDSGTGASTTAFALLAERHGASGITGLDSPDDLARWRPKEKRGYLLQGLTPAAADSLSEVATTTLATLLRQAGAHLVVTVGTGTVLSHDTVPWQVVHRPPQPGEVARKHLKNMDEEGRLTTEQHAEALAHLASALFADYLHDCVLPHEGADMAEGLYDLVTSGKPAADVVADLRTGSPKSARLALQQSSHRADQLSLMAAIALLPGQDRTVVEEFSANLRAYVDERASVMATASHLWDIRARSPEGTEPRHDVLGPAFEDRLTAVGARPLPVRYSDGQRYPVQPVVFTGRHRSEALLRCLWLDYEGMSSLLWKALDTAPHHSGVELAAGQAIGKVLAYATGPLTLHQLYPFAASERRWRRRLVAYALGEIVQHPSLTRAVREQLRQWSKSALVPLRCSVAETCAGKYGLAHPEAALKVLDALFDQQGKELEDPLRTAASFALSTLLSESSNRVLVLDRLRDWQQAAPGTQRHAFAVHIVTSMSLTKFPVHGAPGPSRLRLADLLLEHHKYAFDLVVAALEDPATHDATATGLSLIESDPNSRDRTALPHFLTALAAVARQHPGVLRFILRRHRARTATAEGPSS